MAEEKTALINFAEIRAAFLQPGAEENREATLVFMTGPQVGQQYKLEKASTTIGRDLACDIGVADNGLSRKHAAFIQENDHIIIQDLGSTNGTYYNGERITRRVLEDGDRLLLGNNIVVKFSWQDKLESAYQEQLFNSATRDGLTGCFNKKYLLEHLSGEFSYAARHGTRLSLIMFDIDHFKRVNDTYGHLAGDEILKHVTQTVAAAIRTEDLFARYGGEEFVVLLRDTTLEEAYLAAERLRLAVMQHPAQYQQQTIPITISLGVHVFQNGTPETAQELLLKADEYLYQAKAAGRNSTRCQNNHGNSPH